jgi:hypothetical protein
MALISEWMEQCGKKVNKVLDNAGIVRDLVTSTIDKQQGMEAGFSIYRSFAYSALACFRTGMSGSASFHSVRKS